MRSLLKNKSKGKGKYTLEIVFLLAFAVAAGIIFAV